MTKKALHFASLGLFVGLSGLYKGVTPTIFKQGTNQAIRFFVMESLKEAYRKRRGDTEPNKPVCE